MMNNPVTPTGHCDHERVCGAYPFGRNHSCDTSSGTNYDCPYDTRKQKNMPFNNEQCRICEQEIRELRNALIVAANNAHDRKAIVNELQPSRMFYNEMQFQSLVESALEVSKDFKSEYESDMALNWKREEHRQRNREVKKDE